jgi:chromosome segregation ATPase
MEASVRGLLFSLILISYKLMQQDMFNIIKEGSSVEKMQMLEEKIVKAIDKLKSLGEENSVLNEKISELQGDLVKKDEEIRSVKQELGNVDILMTDIDKLKNEREAVKSQVENLIKELDSVEL